VAVDDRFAAWVAELDAAMIVVTTAAHDERSGCLVGFHGQASIDPPRYAVWLSKANHTYRVLWAAEHVAVHLLGVDDRDLAELFGTETGDEIDKFARCDWEPGPGGVPLLARCQHRFVGRRSALLDDGGDHVCLVLAPVEASTGDGSGIVPLRLSAVVDLEPGHAAADLPVGGAGTHRSDVDATAGDHAERQG
jgi:flavin reductase (DIM6/NTAB) family NADH-FMN oxidoreductase RutF